MKIDIPGASLSLDEQKRITDALAALEKDPHAPREIIVKLTLHVHNEYPKHVVVGTDTDKNPIVKVANNEEEEDALLAEASEPAAPAAN